MKFRSRTNAKQSAKLTYSGAGAMRRMLGGRTSSTTPRARRKRCTASTAAGAPAAD